MAALTPDPPVARIVLRACVGKPSEDTEAAAGFFIKQNLASNLGCTFNTDLLVAWKNRQDDDANCAACRIIAAPCAGLDAKDDSPAEEVQAAPHLVRNFDLELGSLYNLQTVPDYWVPVAQAVLIEVSASDDSINESMPCLKSWELSAFSSTLRERLLSLRLTLRSGSYFTWPFRHDTSLHLRVFLEMANRSGETEMEQENGFKQPCRSWGFQEWRSWFRKSRVGLIGDLTAFKVVPSMKRHVIEGLGSLANESPVDRILFEAFRPDLLTSGLKSFGLITGSKHEVVVECLKRLYPDFYHSVISAASISEALGHRLEEASVGSAYQWLLSQTNTNVPAVIVLVRPTLWFSADNNSRARDAIGFGAMLRQMIDSWLWREYSGASHVPSLVLACILDNSPPREWERLRIFDKLCSLDLPLDGNAHARASRAGAYSPQSSTGGLKIGDLKGLLEAKHWLQRVTQALTCGGQAPSTRVALHGEAGSGKTTFLAALSGSDTFHVMPLVLPDILHAGVGDTQAALRSHFERAAQLRPACVTLDDADMLFANTSHSSALRDLLAELALMIDQHCSPQLIFVATCARLDRLPEALACRLQGLALRP